MELGNVRGKMPSHGLLVNASQWRVTEVAADAHSAHVTSRLEFWRYPDLMAQWPFAHEYEMTYSLADGALEVRTTVTNLSDEAMPIVLGFHPYLRIPGIPRDEWTIHSPARIHVIPGEHNIPTGEMRPLDIPNPLPLRGVKLDDGFTDLARGADGRANFSIESGGKKVEIIFGPKFTVATMWIPEGREFLCIEPLTTIINGVNLAHDGNTRFAKRRGPRKMERKLLDSSDFMIKLASALFLFFAAADPSAVIESAYAPRDFELNLDPNSAEWSKAPRVTASKDYFGQPIPGAPTEIRSRWTNNNLYLFYICPYDDLNLKPDPNAAAETNQLWNWDVAEAFLGGDDEHIGRYKEFEVSPQSEWVDLDIDRENPRGQAGIAWNSGFTVKARIDSQAKIWYGAMKIPWKAIDTRPPQKGRELRIGLYRIAGHEPRTHSPGGLPGRSRSTSRRHSGRCS